MLASVANFVRSLFSSGTGAELPEVPHVKSLSTLESLDSCLSESVTRPVFIFKHSTACPISAEAYRHVAAYAEQANATSPEVYLVKVIEERPVSNQIADQLGLQHKSPQLILVKERKVLWSTSHYGVHADAIRDAVSIHARG